jgi:hypothetical protein
MGGERDKTSESLADGGCELVQTDPLSRHFDPRIGDSSLKCPRRSEKDEVHGSIQKRQQDKANHLHCNCRAPRIMIAS